MVYFQVLVKFNDFPPSFTPHSGRRRESAVLLFGKQDSEPILSEDMEIKMQFKKKGLFCFV